LEPTIEPFNIFKLSSTLTSLCVLFIHTRIRSRSLKLVIMCKTCMHVFLFWNFWAWKKIDNCWQVWSNSWLSIRSSFYFFFKSWIQLKILNMDFKKDNITKKTRSNLGLCSTLVTSVKDLRFRGLYKVQRKRNKEKNLTLWVYV
jgi:hypothetical protein